MKRISGLFDSIAERTTLSVAVQRAAQGKRSRREVRRFIEEFDLPCQTARKHQVILVLPGDIAAACQRQSKIKSCRKTLVLLAQHLHARITDLRQDIPRIICRTIIDGYQLHSPIILFQY